MIEDAKPGDVESVVQEQLDAANSKVVIEELVSWREISYNIYPCTFLSDEQSLNIYNFCYKFIWKIVEKIH